MSPTSDKNIKEQINSLPGPQERAWSVLSHLSSLALGMGIVLPILGWSNQRRKSNYASFQNLQALGYQSLGFTVWIFSYLVILILGAIGLLVMLPMTAEPFRLPG